MAEGVELVEPLPVEGLGVLARLGRAAVDGSFSFDAPPLPGRGPSTELVDEALGLLIEATGHLASALGERFEHLLGSIDHLGLTVHDVVPADTEPRGQLGP